MITQRNTMDANAGNEGWRIWEVILSSSVAVAFFKFLEKLLPYIVMKRKRYDVMRGIEDLHAVYNEMQEAICAGAHRVILLCAHNSGGVPSPGSPFYTSAIHWAAKIEYESRIERYREVAVDGAYVAMLVQLMREGFVHFKMSENHGTMLRGFYHKEGITDAVLVYLGIYDSRMFYISFAVYDGLLSDDQITTFKLRANDIKNRLDLKD